MFEHVDPFIGTEATALPPAQGLAAFVDGVQNFHLFQNGVITPTDTGASSLSLSRNGFGPVEGFFLNGPAVDAVFQLMRFDEMGNLTPIPGAMASKLAAF